jgi:hypothetical protein
MPKIAPQTTLWQIGQLQLLGRIEFTLMDAGVRTPERYLACGLRGVEIAEGGVERSISAWGTEIDVLIDEVFKLATAEGTVVRTSRELRTDTFKFNHEFGSWVDAT